MTLRSFQHPADMIRFSKRENVGSVDDGIKAAAWSPDDELLVLITGASILVRCVRLLIRCAGDDKLIEMTKDFEVLSEGPLRSAEFGDGAFVHGPSIRCD